MNKPFCRALVFLPLFFLLACGGEVAPPAPTAVAAEPAPAVEQPADSAPAPAPPDTEPVITVTDQVGPIRIVFLHHSTGGVIYGAGLAEWIQAYNSEHGTNYAIEERAYPSAPYPWDNYPYDYWNIWVKHAGAQPFQGQDTLEKLTAAYDVIIWKHCFPVSAIEPDNGPGDVGSNQKTLANYRAQYEELKTAMRRFPKTLFIVCTGAALTRAGTNPESARRSQEFASWVRTQWDQPGDNIFVWDFRQLETQGGLYLFDQFAAAPEDAHQSPSFAKRVMPFFGRRIVGVIEGRGDKESLTGE